MKNTETSYKQALEEFINSSKALPEWGRHIPDELCAKIENLSDFRDFLHFVNKNRDSDFLEFGCNKTDIFIDRIVEHHDDNKISEYARSKGIVNEFGLLAYLVILSLSN